MEGRKMAKEILALLCLVTASINSASSMICHSFNPVNTPHKSRLLTSAINGAGTGEFPPENTNDPLPVSPKAIIILDGNVIDVDDLPESAIIKVMDTKDGYIIRLEAITPPK